jgi:hypothetical protein
VPVASYPSVEELEGNFEERDEITWEDVVLNITAQMVLG